MLFFNKKLIYFVENADWVIRWEGEQITEYLNNNYKLRSGVIDIIDTDRINRIKNKILHFGSRNIYLPKNYKYIDRSNQVILTWFHGSEEDKDFIESLPSGSKKADIIHTACTISKRQLIKWGAQEEKIVIIPLAIDLNNFKPFNSLEKQKIRQELNIPEGAICIGSFQKDGNGWGEGNTPKLIKGPDIFCQVIKEIKNDYPIFILLTGPARGYVKNQLKEMGVPYKHLYIKNHLNMPKYYGALDYYVISSRIEGGPKALLECFATGIPFITTRVGMVDDIMFGEQNKVVSEIEDIGSLAANLRCLIEDENFKRKMIVSGLETVKDFSWPNIVEQYFNKIYSKFL